MAAGALAMRVEVGDLRLLPVGQAVDAVLGKLEVIHTTDRRATEQALALQVLEARPDLGEARAGEAAYWAVAGDLGQSSVAREELRPRLLEALMEPADPDRRRAVNGLLQAEYDRMRSREESALSRALGLLGPG